VAGQEPRFRDFLVAAFTWKVRIGGLGHIPINLLIIPVFLVLGLLNPGFFLLGVAAEAAYLFGLAGSSRFQKIVQGLRLLRAQGAPLKDSERQAQLLAALDEQARTRHQAISRTCASILQTSESFSGPVGGAELKSGGLDQLLWIFLKLLVSRQRISMILSQTSSSTLEEEIASTRRRLEAQDESSPLSRSLKGTLDIQIKRLENIQRAAESLKVTEAELERIEKQVALMREEVSVSSDPQFLSVRLDGIVDSLQGTTKWMTEHDELFSRLDADTLPVDLLAETPGKDTAAPRAGGARRRSR
jgi:hypothetical protein